MPELGPREVGGAGEHHEADQQVGDAFGGDPQHHDEQREEQQRRAEVLLGHHHDDGEPPRQHDRRDVARFGEVERADLPRGRGDQLATVGEVGGEEDGEGDLGELAGLEVDRPEADPDPRAVDVAAEAGNERQHQQAGAADEEHSQR